MKRLVLCVPLLLVGCPSATTPGDGDSGAVDANTPTHDVGIDANDCPDGDGDGARAASCGGTDCDDARASVSPDTAEICDAADLDEDCNPSTFGTRDQDNDMHVDAMCCNGTNCGDDCDDTHPFVHPGAVEMCNETDDDCDGMIDEGAAATRPEVCNGMDDDCDAIVDEGATMTLYVDADHDGFGDPSAPTVQMCNVTAGYATNMTDCNDADQAVHPGSVDTCNGLDDDCDGTVDNTCACASGASRPCAGAVGRCANGTEMCIGAGWSLCSVMPIAETCNGMDDDCNGTIDDGVTVTCYLDGDGDGFASAAAAPVAECPTPTRPAVGGCPIGYTNRAPSSATSIDCNDASAAQFPGAAEHCNGIDDDCNAAVDDNCT